MESFGTKPKTGFKDTTEGRWWIISREKLAQMGGFRNKGTAFKVFRPTDGLLHISGGPFAVAFLCGLRAAGVRRGNLLDPVSVQS